MTHASNQAFETIWANHATHADQTLIESHASIYAPFLEALRGAGSVASRPLAPLKVLEIGCGTGVDSALLAQTHEAHAVALDLSFTSTVIARRVGRACGVNLLPCVGSGFQLPFADGSFDLVFSQGVIEHFHEYASMVAEHGRVVRPGGRVVISVPQKYNPYTVKKWWAMRQGRWPYGWEGQLSVGELRVAGERAGLTPLAAYGQGANEWRYLAFRTARFAARHPHPLIQALDRAYQTGLEHFQQWGWRAFERRWGAWCLRDLIMVFARDQQGSAR